MPTRDDRSLYDVIYPNGYAARQRWRGQPAPRPPLASDDWPSRPPLPQGAPQEPVSASTSPGDDRETISAAPNPYGFIGPRLYRPVFVSPRNAANPAGGVQIVEASQDPKAGLIGDAELYKVDQAIRDLDKSDKARASIDAGLHKGVRLDINDQGQTRYRTMVDPEAEKRNVIDWDPEVQLRLMNDDASLRDDYQSPAMGLGHEFEHPSSPYPNRIPLGPLWTNNEEKRVVTEWEAPVARSLGEPERNNHLGLAAYRVPDPTYIQPGYLDPELLRDDWKAFFKANPAQAGMVRTGPLTRR